VTPELEAGTPSGAPGNVIRLDRSSCTMSALVVSSFRDARPTRANKRGTP
jgi:hypothetical protein